MWRTSVSSMSRRAGYLHGCAARQRNQLFSCRLSDTDAGYFRHLGWSVHRLGHKGADGPAHGWPAEQCVVQLDLDCRPQPLLYPGGGPVWQMPDGILAFIARPGGRLVRRVESEAACLQRHRDAMAQLFELPTQGTAADRCCRAWHDFEIHILRHAPDDAVRAGQRRAAAKDEHER